MNTQEVLRTILRDSGLDVRQFSERIDYPASKLYDIQRGKTIKFKDDLINRIIAVFPKYNRIWLITGEGDRYVPQDKPNTKPAGKISEKPTPSRDSAETVPTTTSAQNEQQPANLPLADAILIPLVTPTAVAGFGNDTFAIQEADVKEYYIVPKFRYNRVDFMIEISGSSMYPKYNSGDVVACTILHDSSFIQWNKCHVIATREQGLLCKRLMQSETADALRLVSDNPNYPPFDVPKSEITGIALVIGVIRLE